MSGLAWQQWVLLAWLAVGLVSSTARVGRPRLPVTSREHAIATVVLVIFAALVASI